MSPRCGVPADVAATRPSVTDEMSAATDNSVLLA
jgi:hypothetical protein